MLAGEATGDFHQVEGSPTINAGDAGASMLGTTDLDGDPRTLGAAPDIGADEFVPAATPPPPGDTTPPDTTPPDTTITKGPKDKSRKKQATFEFSSIEPGSSFECSLDGGGFEPCTSPRDVKVKKGKHSFSVRATDAAGNVDPTPATRDWTVKKKKRKK